MKAAINIGKNSVLKPLPIAILPSTKKIEHELLSIVPEIKHNPIMKPMLDTDNRKIASNIKIKDKSVIQKRVNLPNSKPANKATNMISLENTKNEEIITQLVESPEDKKPEHKQIFFQESIEVPSDKKDDDSVLMGSQESSLNMMPPKSPQISCGEKLFNKVRGRFVTKRSPFSEIVDEGISEYLGNHSYISNKNKSSKFW